MTIKLPSFMRHGLWLICALAVNGCSFQIAKTVVTGDNRQLRERRSEQPSPAPYNDLLILALDGVDRALLYEMLNAGEMPNLALLLGGSDGNFPNAAFSERLHSVLPSSTAIAWASAFTGASPAEHGVVGNEYFIRETGEFAAPVAVTVDATETMLSTFNESYFNKLLARPSVYRQMREKDPEVLIWVALQQVFDGADRLLITDRSVLFSGAQAFATALIRDSLTDSQSHDVVAKLDAETIEEITESLKNNAAPDVLTVYLAGTDKIAHVAKEGPIPARRKYMREKLDEQLGLLRTALDSQSELDNRYVVIVSDHGHTEVLHDEQHSLANDFVNDPPALIKASGYTLRPFKLEVPEGEVFDAVLAYQGGMAYISLADRSSCPQSAAQGTSEPCDWKLPARYKQDVLPLADAFYQNNKTGGIVPALQNTLDMVLVRRPAAFYQAQKPFEVYTGNGQTVAIDQWLAKHPQPRYFKLAERMRKLAVGQHGARVGEVVLIANNGNVDSVDGRYYFASLYKSWHGSPSRQDAEVPLIVSHPKRSAAEIEQQVNQVIEPDATLEQFSNLLLKLRFSVPQATH